MLGKISLAISMSVLIAMSSYCSVPAQAQELPLSQGQHVADLKDLKIHYTVTGHGPFLVVQAPGWGIGSDYLENGLAALKSHFTLITFSPRGTGASSPVISSETLTNSDMVEDLERLRNYWGLDRMDLLGHSNGSAIAILYAERYPERVHKLVLIGSQLLGYRSKNDSVKAAEEARRKSDPNFAYYLAHINDPEPKTDAAFTAYFEKRVGYYFYDPARDVPIFLETMTQPMGASVHQAFLEVPPASQAPPLTDLGRITAETLIIEGRQDPACPLNESEMIHAGISGSKLIAIDRSGHFPWIEQPAEFFPAVVQFLNIRSGTR